MAAPRFLAAIVIFVSLHAAHGSPTIFLDKIDWTRNVVLPKTEGVHFNITAGFKNYYGQINSDLVLKLVRCDPAVSRNCTVASTGTGVVILQSQNCMVIHNNTHMDAINRQYFHVVFDCNFTALSTTPEGHYTLDSIAVTGVNSVFLRGTGRALLDNINSFIKPDLCQLPIVSLVKQVAPIIKRFAFSPQSLIAPAKQANVTLEVYSLSPLKPGTSVSFKSLTGALSTASLPCTVSASAPPLYTVSCLGDLPSPPATVLYELSAISISDSTGAIWNRLNLDVLTELNSGLAHAQLCVQPLIKVSPSIVKCSYNSFYSCLKSNTRCVDAACPTDATCSKASKMVYCAQSHNCQNVLDSWCQTGFGFLGVNACNSSLCRTPPTCNYNSLKTCATNLALAPLPKTNSEVAREVCEGIRDWNVCAISNGCQELYRAIQLCFFSIQLPRDIITP